MSVSPDDERPHAPGAELSWTESTWLELYDEASELAGVARLDVRPNEGTSEVALSFFLPDGGFITARHVAPRVVGPSATVEIEDARLETVEPLRHWTVQYDGPAHSLGSVADAGKRDAWLKSRLERLIVELDVTALHDAVASQDAFAQPVRITGEVWVSGDQYPLAARGLRGRSWGSGLVPRRASRVALVFGDDRALLARRVATGDAGEEADALDGWTLRDGVVRPVRELRLDTSDRAPAGTAQLALTLRDDHGEIGIDAELVHVAPLPGIRGGRPYVVRLGVARARWDGRAGYGFVEEVHQPDDVAGPVR